MCGDLLRPEGLGGEARRWLTPNIRTWLTTASLSLEEAVRNNDESMRQISNQLEYETVGYLLIFSRET